MSLQKLIAFDEEDLLVLSASLQDASLYLENMVYLSQERRFALVAERFAREEDGLSQSSSEKRQVGVHFDHVLQVQKRGLENAPYPLQLLAIQFEAVEAPGGYVRLVCAGGAEIRLKVECIGAVLSDLCMGEKVLCPIIMIKQSLQSL